MYHQIIHAYQRNVLVVPLSIVISQMELDINKEHVITVSGDHLVHAKFKAVIQDTLNLVILVFLWSVLVMPLELAIFQTDQDSKVEVVIMVLGPHMEHVM